MATGNISSKLVTLNLQLALDATANATVAFRQAGGNLFSIFLTFGVDAGGDIAPGIMSVRSFANGVDGSTLYSFQTNYVQSQVFDIHFSLDTLGHTFDLTVGDKTMASNATFSGTISIDDASLYLGDFGGGAHGAYGDVAVDNILLTASAIPEPSTFVFVAIGLAGILGLRRRRR